MLPCLVSVLLTFYVQGVLKFGKKKSVAKRLILSHVLAPSKYVLYCRSLTTCFFMHIKLISWFNLYILVLLFLYFCSAHYYFYFNVYLFWVFIYCGFWMGRGNNVPFIGGFNVPGFSVLETHIKCCLVAVTIYTGSLQTLNFWNLKLKNI